MSVDLRICPHCGSSLRKWRVPVDSSWTDEFFYVCFDDDCPYYKKGWAWMSEKYNQKASYRFAWSPDMGDSTMIPVWSDAATRDLIEDDPPGGDE